MGTTGGCIGRSGDRDDGGDHDPLGAGRERRLGRRLYGGAPVDLLGRRRRRRRGGEGGGDNASEKKKTHG